MVARSASTYTARRPTLSEKFFPPTTPVVEGLIQEWDQKLIIGILQSTDEPKIKLNEMLNWALASHAEMEMKRGCPLGNLAIEMSEHDETFRAKIQQFFERWIEGVEYYI